MNNYSYLITFLLTIINLLSLFLIGGLSFFLRSLWTDMKQVRTELTGLVAEHNIYKEMCHKRHVKETDNGET